MSLSEEQTRIVCGKFVEKTCKQDKIWGLESKDGWAISLSPDDEEIQVIPFWSAENRAWKYCIDEWSDYKPAAIDRGEFIFDWLNGMANDEVMVGLDWSDDADELEVDPTLLAEVFAAYTD